MLASKNAKRVMSVFCAFALALTAMTPFVGKASGLKAAAAATRTESGGYVYDFRDGSVVATTATVADSPKVTVDNMTVGAGYRYNDGSHGVELTADNSIEIKVDGPTRLIVGDCSYNTATELTVTSADGSYSQTKTVKTGCYHNGTSIEFRYEGTAATTLTLKYNDKAYVSVIQVEAFDNTPDNNGVPKDSIYQFNLTDNTIVPDANDVNNPIASSVSSKDGVLTITSNNNLYKFSNQHGVALSTGNTFNIKVAGDAVVKFNLCEESNAGASTITASAPKGEFAGATTLPLVLGTTDGLSIAYFVYNGPATTLTFTVKKDGGETLYLHDINVSNLPEDTDPPKAAGNGKIDVWDFGAEQLDSSKYNNMLNVDTINGIYEGKYEPGTSGIPTASFVIGDFIWMGTGKGTDRIRTTNTAITRWDDKHLEYEGTDYTGYLYSNGAYPYYYVGMKLYENDILTLIMGTNGNPSTIYFESPSGDIQIGYSDPKGAKLTFTAPEYGLYKIYSINEKVVLYRAFREHTNPVKVTGKVDTSAASGIPNDYMLCFVNTSTGVGTLVDINSDGTYSVHLNDSYSYELALVGANGFMIKDNVPLEIKSGSGNVTKDVTIVTVDLVTVTGKITGLSADALSKLKLSFVNKENPYIPEFTISGDSITMQLERGVSYDVVAEGVNDYVITNSPISMTANGTKDLVFALKPTYDINVSYDGLPDSAKSTAVLTFTNLTEPGYVYTFKAGETPKLRDGSYSVQVSGTGTVAYAQKLTSNVNVSGKAVSKTISFEPLEKWDFAVYNTTNGGAPGIETIGDNKYYLGLELTGNVQENKTYLLANSGGEIKIPVKKGMLVTLTFCYSADFEVNGKSYTTENSTGSTSKTDVVTLTAENDGFVTIKANGTTYFNSIAAAAPVAYKDTVTVGANKDYKTINDALAAVAKMSRTDSQRVNIVIDPGNYEEMLVINVPNVTLSNAAGKNSSLAVVNKGVDIGKNVVRITSYYGHGYDYFSMGSDAKWHADVLAANKENGYISAKNPGAGTTNGSYWNSTVVVYANGFEADGIVFENSFNQYISKKEAEDTVVMWESGGKGIRPTKYGDTSVQARGFVERAGALSIVNDVKEVVFNNCKFIGRQDTLFGGAGTEALFQKCDIYGGVDYIYGGMTAVFYQCNLVMNNDENMASDQSYLTAAQQSSGRGYLMYNCTVTSTTPGVDTANEHLSKPGYLGRPWQPNTSEVVFYYTVIEDTNFPGSEGKSLVVPAGWNDSLGGQSPYMYEFGTIELSKENNSAERASWTKVLDKPVLADGSEISIKTFLGDWTDTLNARGLAVELTEDQMNKEAVRDNRNPATGIPAGIGTAVALIAIAGSAILVAKKKK